MKKILVAGIGNSWLSDDGFGGAVVKALEQRELPPEAAVFDFGTGGLDLAYEIMRGYDALYVMETTEEEVDAGIEDGQALNPHGMDPQTVLRFVKTLGGWPGRVLIVACEPAVVEEMGMTLSAGVQAAVTGAVDLVLETIEDLRHDAAYAAVE
jgi:hydrogenase maturation protease